MESLSVIHSQLSASVWAVSIVLMDAYLHIPFHPVVQEFFWVLFFSSWAGPSNSRSCPSGLKVFPWVFTRVGGHSCRSSSPVRSSSVLLFGRLASGGGVQGSFGVSSPYDPAVVSGPWVPSDLGKVFPSLHRDFLFILGLISTSQGCWLGLQSSEFWLFRSVSGSFLRVLWRPPSFGRKFFGHLAGFVDLVPYCRLLMRPLQLHLLRDFTPLIDSQDLLVSLEFRI